MSAIGDYVHLTWEGYKTGHKVIGFEQIKYQDAAKALEAKHNQIQRRYQKMKKENVRKILQIRADLMMSWLLEKDPKEGSEAALMQKAYRDLMNSIEYKNIQFNEGKILQGKKGAIVDSAKVKELQDIQKRLQSLQERCNKYSKIYSSGSAIIDDLMKIRNDLLNIISDKSIIDIIDKDIYNRILVTDKNFLKEVKNKIKVNNEALEVVRKSVKMDNGVSVTTYQTLIDFSQGKINMNKTNLVSQMNRLINSLLQHDYRQIAGFFAEDLFVEGFNIANDMGQAIALQEGAKIAKKPKADSRVLKSNQIYGLSSLETTSYIPNDNGNLQLASKSSVKVDLTVALSDKYKAGISMKNTSQLTKEFGWISIVSGIPLLSLLQDENQNNFVNHYLNLTVNHSDSEKINNNILNMAHDTMRLLLAFKGLTGSNIAITETEKMMEAEFFVILNNENNRVYVFSMGDIMQIIDDTLFQSHSATNLISGYSRDWFKKANKAVKSEGQINQRLVNIVQTAYNTKVHMKIAANVLRRAASTKITVN